MADGKIAVQSTDGRIYTVTPEVGAAGNVSVTLPKEGGVVASETYVDTAISASADSILSIIASSTTGPYGVEWNSITDSYQRVGATNVTQVQSQMKRCVLNANGTVNYFLHPNDSTKKADGSVSVIDGSAGNVMVQIPKFWYKYVYEDSIHKVSVSPIATSGYTVHPAFTRGGVEVDYRYYRAYEGYLNGAKLISRSGITPTRNRTITQYRADALVNGTGWSQTDWNLLYAVQILFLTEFATFDTQSILGNGNDTGSDYSITTGQSNAIGNASSSKNNDDMWMSYRGIENWYGDGWEFIDGINISEYIPFVNNMLPSTYVSDVFTGNYVTTGVTIPAASASYTKNFHNSAKGFIPSVVGGSSATYATDGLWTAAGSRVLLFGGSAGDGLLDGGFCLAADYGSASVSVSIGSGVSF